MCFFLLSSPSLYSSWSVAMAMAIDEYRLEINHLPSAQLPLLRHHSAIKEAFFLFLVSPDQSHCRALQKKKKQQNLASLQCFSGLCFSFSFFSSHWWDTSTHNKSSSNEKKHKFVYASRKKKSEKTGSSKKRAEKVKAPKTNKWKGKGGEVIVSNRTVVY